MSGGEDKIEVNKDLIAIRGEIRKPIGKRMHDSEVEQITNQLKSLTNDIETIKESISNSKDSHTKLKKKKEIIFLLKKNEEITTSQLSEKIDLSRTRCSEYLNELKREGIVETEKRGRSKYYKMNI